MATQKEKGSGRWRKGCLLFLAVVVVLAALPFLWRSWVESHYGRHIVDPEELAPRRVAIVFGAAVYRNGRLSPMLRDRVETAISLYEEGLVDYLLFSGDNQTLEYNEPGSMMAYAIERGVPEEAIQPDYGGRRTYDTCYRARHIFQVDSAVLVTQSFHLPRALYTCDSLGLDAVGVSADRRQYHPRTLAWQRNRELAALVRAFVDATLQPPPPVLGEPIPIS